MVLGNCDHEKKWAESKINMRRTEREHPGCWQWSVSAGSQYLSPFKRRQLTRWFSKGYARHHGPIDFWGQRDGEADKKASARGSGVA